MASPFPVATTSLVSARIEKARAMLESARSIDDWKVGIGDIVTEYAEYDRRKSLSEDAHVAAWELIQLSNRCLGRILKDLPKAKRGPKPKASQDRGLISGSENKPKVVELRALGLNPKRAYELERLADMPDDEFDRRRELGREKIRQHADPGQITATSSASDHDGDSWGTPEQHVEAAREVLGGIELDPASNANAANIIRAVRFYTKQDSGLLVPWKARSVWLNPPYSAQLVAQFENKFIAEFEAGNFESGITLINASTDTSWFQELLARFAVCFTKGRIGFLSNGKPISNNNRGQAFFYAGTDVPKFHAVFSRFGRIVVPYAGGARA